MALYPDYVIQEVNQRLDIRQLMETIDYKTNKLQEQGDTIRGFCPIHKESVFRTLVIERSKRSFRCMYGLCAGAKGGSLVQLLALSRGVSVDEAVHEILQTQKIQIVSAVSAEDLIGTIKEAENYLTLGRFEEAESLFRQVLVMRGDSIQAHEGLLKLARERDDKAGIIDRLATLTRLHLALEQVDKANELSAELEEADPDSLEGKLLRAEVHLASRQYMDALFSYMEVADQYESTNRADEALHSYAQAEKLQLDHNLDEVDVLPHILRLLMATNRAEESVGYLRQRAEQMAMKGETTIAASLYAEAVTHAPQDLDVHKRFVEIIVQAPMLEELVGPFLSSIEFIRATEGYDLAIERMRQFVEQNPTHGISLQRLADLLYSNGQPAEGGKVEATLAKMALENGRAVEAKDRLLRLLDWQPEHPESLQVLAMVEDRLGDRLAASNVRRRLAKSLLQRRDFQNALSALDQALELDPNSVEILEQRAGILETMGNALRSDERLREAASIYGKLASDLMQRGESTDRVREMRLLERAANTDPNPPVDLLLRLSRSYLANGNRVACRDTLIRASEILVAAGQATQAVERAEEFAALIPGDLDLVYYIAELLAREGDAHAAECRLRKQARAMAIRGAFDEAEEVFESARRIAVDESAMIDDLADIYREAGDEDRQINALLRAVAFHESRADHNAAIKTLARLIEIVPEETIPTSLRIIDHADRLKRTNLANEWRVKLAVAYHDQGDLDRESRILKEILQKDPEHEGALCQLLVTELEKGDQAGAIRNAKRLYQKQVADNRPADALQTIKTLLARVEVQPELLSDAMKVARLAGDLSGSIQYGRNLRAWFLENKRGPDALAVSKSLLEMMPSDTLLHQDHVKLLEQLGITGELQSARLALAQSFLSNELYPQAEALLLSLIATNPQYTVAREELIGLYGRLGKTEAVEEQLLYLAESLSDSGNEDLGIQTLRRILEKHPGNGGVRRLLVEFLIAANTEVATAEAVQELWQLADDARSAGNETEALLCERTAADADPTNPLPRRRLAESYLTLDRPKPAAQELCLIAAMHQSHGRIREALVVLEEALAVAPDCLDALRLRAELYSLPGPTHDSTAALQDLKTVTALQARKTRELQQDQSASIGQDLNPDFQFETFIVGSSNRFAHATCLAAARNPGRAFNPVFLYSESGLGKTHLLHAMAQHVQVADPAARIVMMNGLEFFQQFTEATQSKKQEDFLEFFREVDLFFLDDIQGFGKDQGIQDEFFQLLHQLLQGKRQVVVAGTTQPASLSQLDPRLRAKLASGVLAEIKRPDPETGKAILELVANQHGIQVEPTLLQEIAQRFSGSVKDLRRSLLQIHDRQTSEGRRFTMEEFLGVMTQLIANEAGYVKEEA